MTVAADLTAQQGAMRGKVFLQTERLIFRQLVPEDARLLFELDSDPEVMRYLSKGRPTPFERIENEILPMLLKFYEEHDHLGYWALHEKSSGDFIGWFHFRPDKYEPSEIELGYRLKRAAWGQGYATEGSKALIEKAFTEWNIGKVVARALIGNMGSRRVMEKCGLRLEETFFYDGEQVRDWTAAERESVKYAMTSDDYRRRFPKRPAAESDACSTIRESSS